MEEFDFPRNRKAMDINLIPMVNVIFLLLIFFLVAGTIEKLDVVPIDPPVAQSGKILDEGHIVILLGTHEEVVLDEDLIEMEDIIPLVSEKLKNYPEKVITIKADGSVPAKRLIEAMDYVKAAGGINLSLVTQAPLGKS